MKLTGMNNALRATLHNHTRRCFLSSKRRFSKKSSTRLKLISSPGGTPVRGGDKYEPLNLICTKSKGNAFKWMHQTRSGKLQVAGNKWLNKKFLCRKCHKDCDGDGGDGGEGSGAESPDNANVSL